MSLPRSVWLAVTLRDKKVCQSSESAPLAMTTLVWVGAATMGLASGAIASAVAIWPTLVRSGQVEQVLPHWLLLAAGLLASGLLWASVASLWATRGPLVEALREE